MPSSALIQAVMVTAELTRTSLSEPAARVMLQDLSAYPEAQVIGALTRCRKDLPGRGGLTVSEIVRRLDDGRPSPEEAWAMIPRDERLTVVWTEEMVEAWGIALPLISEGELVAARMAFKEAYQRACIEAREGARAVVWRVSRGNDPGQCEQAVLEAVRRGRLEVTRAALYLPNHEVRGGELVPIPDRSMLTVAEVAHRLLPGPHPEAM